MAPVEDKSITNYSGLEIAVIGMACRFPGANSLDQYWENLVNGVESVRNYSDEELLKSGVSENLLENSNYIKSGAPLDEMEMFDAGFFGFNPTEASVMDPQHRHFLECSWQALEHAGCDPYRFSGAIGVFAGSGHNSYMPNNLQTNPELMSELGFFLVRHTGNDKDFMATRVSNIFNLTGPSLNIQTACSTSLVSIHYGCQSLLSGECDIALAGGVTIELPHCQGYQYKENEILSSDGHCRSFDAASDGTIFGSGVGTVVLKRLEDAIRDGDTVHAVVRGSAVNNDGALKAGYLAPSVDGQAKVIAEALASADVEPSTIRFIEAHGTGTPVGDPIEFAALRQAYEGCAEQRNHCAVGSVKSNIGHLDTAAGVASLIKVILSLKNRKIPPTLHFDKPNPELGIEDSPFFINPKLIDWPFEPHVPLRAGVTSLGVGGTNAHIILEEAPPPRSSRAVEPKPFQLLTLSAKDKTVLEDSTADLKEYFDSQDSENVVDAAYTLSVGRASFEHRRYAVVKDRVDAISALGTSERIRTVESSELSKSVVFLFAGGGAQYPGMGFELYSTEPVYRENVDRCIALLQPDLNFDLFSVLFPDLKSAKDEVAELERPSRALPALFITQFALAKLWESWGVVPSAMIGHSMGEYTAACLAGVFNLEAALKLVLLRGQLFETVPEGRMLSVNISGDELRSRMKNSLSIAALNGPELTVASGSSDELESLRQELEAEGIESQWIRISVAAHSSMLEDILEPFRKYLQKISLSEPTKPYISNLSGTWVTQTEATDPEYWVKHLRNTVNFSDGISTLLDSESRFLLEIGPGRTLTSLASLHPSMKATDVTCCSLRHPQQNISDAAFILESLGSLWANRVEIDWESFYQRAPKSKIPLPTYPFRRERHWIEPGKSSKIIDPSYRSEDVSEWFHVPCWKETLLPIGRDMPEQILIFSDRTGLGERVVESLVQAGVSALVVTVGTEYRRVADLRYEINPANANHYNLLLQDIGFVPKKILHFWGVTFENSEKSLLENLETVEDECFFSLFHLARALDGLKVEDGSKELLVFSNLLQQVSGEETFSPTRALLQGPCTVIPAEYPSLQVRSVDVELPRADSWRYERLISQISSEISYKCTSREVPIAYRGAKRFERGFEQSELPDVEEATSRLRSTGVYLITGGLGGIGLTVAREFAESASPKLALLARTPLPPREEWKTYLLSAPSEDRRAVSIREVLGLEELGAEVLVVQGDVANLDDMKRVVSTIRDTFGEIRGVVHAAGVLNDSPMELKDREGIRKLFAPKVKGTLVLDQVFEGTRLDFFVLFSSVSALLGLPGQVDYSAANAFLDAFAQYRTSRDGAFTVSLAWSVWQEVGMAADLVSGNARGLSNEPIKSKIDHDFFDEQSFISADEVQLFKTFSGGSDWRLTDHQLRGGTAILPGAALIEIAYEAARYVSDRVISTMSDVLLVAPFTLESESSRELRVDLKFDDFEMEISLAGNFGDTETEHWVELLTCNAEFIEATKLPKGKAKKIRRKCRVIENRSSHEQSSFIEFGARYDVVQQVALGDLEAVLDLELPERFVADLEMHSLHPALLDISTAGAISLIPGYSPDSDFYVPLSVESVKIFEKFPKSIWSHIRSREVRDGGDIIAFDITIYNGAGIVLVEISNFAMKRLSGSSILVENSRVQESIHKVKEGSVNSTVSEELHALVDRGIKPSEGREVFHRLLKIPSASYFAIAPTQVSKLMDQSFSSRIHTKIGHTEPDIDLSEVTLALENYFAVQKAYVVAVSDRLGDVRVIAYVQNIPGESCTVSELRKHLRSRVSSEKVPSYFAIVDELRSDKDGKVDVSALPNPFENDSSYIAPETKSEMLLVDIWSAVLGIKKISTSDNFIDIGGHSLLAVKVLSKIRKTTGVWLDPPLMLLQTLGQIAAEVDRRVSDSSDGSATEGSLGGRLRSAVKEGLRGSS